MGQTVVLRPASSGDVTRWLALPQSARELIDELSLRCAALSALELATERARMRTAISTVHSTTVARSVLRRVLRAIRMHTECLVCPCGARDDSRLLPHTAKIGLCALLCTLRRSCVRYVRF